MLFRSMWSGYRTAVNEVLPKALVVVDKFHVIKMANEQMDSARKYFYKYAPHGLKKSKSLFLMREDNLTEKAISYRDEWFEQYPKLKIAYALKESFYRIYDCSTRFEAERAFREWHLTSFCLVRERRISLIIRTLRYATAIL